MANDFTIRAVNDWRGAVHVDLARALRVSQDVWRRDAENATKHMLIVMAQSARAMTPQARKNRKVQRDEHGEYVEVVKSGVASKRYRWMFSGADPKVRGTWEGAKSIRYRGLAKRSWMWGLSKAGGKETSKAIPGTSEVGKVSTGGRVVGWFKRDSLSYIDKIMPSGWLAAVEQKAINRVMKQAETRMVRQFEREVGRR